VHCIELTREKGLDSHKKH